MKTLIVKRMSSVLSLLLMGLILSACGGDVSKKDNGKKSAATLSTEEPTGNVDPGVAAMGSSSGRYEAADAMACSTNTQNYVNGMYRVVNDNLTVDSGHYYLYSIREYKSGNFQGQWNVPVNADAPYNIGMQVMTQRRASDGKLVQYIYATHVLGGWKTLGQLYNTVTSGVTDKEIFRIDTSSATVTSTGGGNDDESTLKSGIITMVNSTLNNQAGFNLEQFSDSNGNQVLLVTGKEFTGSDGKKYDFEFGREAQPLKPLACAGYKYPAGKCKYSSYCK